MSQAALAEAAGIAQTTVSHAERGVHVPHSLTARTLEATLLRLEADQAKRNA